MDPLEILSFWFGTMDGRPPKNNIEYIQSRLSLWFGKNEEFELKQKEIVLKGLDKIKSLEQPTQQQSHENDYDWSKWSTPEGYLARVILFDQFPRCVFRATAKAFEYDHLAVHYALKIIEDGYWDYFSAIERLFLIVAIQHTEDIVLQRKGVELASIIAQGENDEIATFFRTLKGFPMEHHNVIQQFGRFPGRNAVLVSF